MSEKKLLEKGDKIYEMSYREVTRIHVITRVTKAQAFSENQKFSRAIDEAGKIKELGGTKSKWHRPTYEVETPKLKEKWERRLLVSRYERTNPVALTTDQLRRIAAILDEPKPTT